MDDFFFPNEKTKIEPIARRMPTHCHRLSRSPKISSAPMSVHIGRVACIGLTTEIGRCLSEMYPKIQELRTMTDLRKVYRCAVKSSFGTKKGVVAIISGAMFDKRSGTDSRHAEIQTLIVSTSTTLLSRSATFLDTS